jgi:hypothetical protein
MLVPAFVAGWLACPDAQQVAPLQPQARIARPELRAVEPQSRIEKVLELNSTFGDRDVFRITPGRPGTISVEVAWRGSTDRLAVILNGPGQTGYYARQDSGSPLTLTFEVTREVYARGEPWVISVVNFSGAGRAVGRVVVTYPAATTAIATLTPAMRRIRDAAIAAPTPPGTAPEKSILPDGRVQVRYPDGRVVIYGPGCGFTTIMPDGSMFEAQCSQVQPDTLPGLPDDAALRSFLESHRDHLLEQISQLVDHRQSEVDLYLAYEADNAAGLLSQIQMRARLIDTLLR